LAAIGVWVTLISDARDERGEMFDLEAQGVPPGTLRNQLRLRSVVLMAFGIVGGLVLGLVLSRLVVSVVSVSAETTTPVPPLVTDPAWGTAAVGLAVLVLLVLGLTELTARHALRGQTPSRGAWTLE
jgi:ABC-type antimicrobial peptide transport system permease subunit